MGWLSIVIPTFQRRQHLENILTSLNRAAEHGQWRSEDQGEEYPVEVVVVIDGSTDGSDELARNFPAVFPIKVLTQPNAGLAAARNTGWRSAVEAEVVWFLDDDMTISAASFSAHLHQAGVLRGERRRVVFGPCWIRQAERKGRFSATWHNGLYRQLIAEGETENPAHIHFANTLVPRSLLAETEGFDESLVGWGGEDNEFAYRLLNLGTRFGFDEQLAVEHHRERAARDQVGNWRDAGRNLGRIHKRHPELGLLLASEFEPRKTIDRILSLPPGLFRSALVVVGPRIGNLCVAAADFLPGRITRDAIGVANQACHLLGLLDVDADEQMVRAVAGRPHSPG